MPFLRIVIPTKNEEEYLPKLAETIEAQTFKNLEVIVADAGSTDKTRKIAKSLGYRVVRGGRPDVGRNNGARGSKSEILCFADSDLVLPRRDFIENALNEIEERNLDVAATLETYFKTDNSLKNLIYGVFYGISRVSIKMSERTKNPLMQNLMFVRTKAFNEAGGFPPYEFGEDSALAKAVVSKGYKFGVLKTVPEIPVSPRRFENRGIFKMMAEYVYLNGMRIFGHEFERGKTKVHYFNSNRKSSSTKVS